MIDRLIDSFFHSYNFLIPELIKPDASSRMMKSNSGNFCSKMPVEAAIDIVCVEVKIKLLSTTFRYLNPAKFES